MRHFAGFCAALAALLLFSSTGAEAAEKPSVQKTVTIRQLNEAVDVFDSVLLVETEPHPFREFLAAQDLSFAENALDIGTGCGVLALIVLKQGAKRVVATDILPAAVENARHNAGKLGLSEKMDVRLVPEDSPGAYSIIKDGEKFDLIVSSPPWDDADPSSVAENQSGISPYNYNDKEHQLLKSLIRGLKARLTAQGRAWLYLGRERMVNIAIQTAKEEALAINLRSPGILFSGENPDEGVVLYTILELALP